MTKRKRFKRLTPAQKKAVWAEPSANAGAGWSPRYPKPQVRFDEDPDDIGQIQAKWQNAIMREDP